MRRFARFSQRLLDDPAIAHVVAVAGRGFNGSSDTTAGNLAQLTAVMADPAASGDAIARSRQSACRGNAPDAAYCRFAGAAWAGAGAD